VESVVQDSNGLDVTLRITDVTGLQRFIALAGMQHALKPTGKRTQLLNHKKHRFAKGMCEADAAAADVEPSQQEPTEAQLVTKWAEVISKRGMLTTLRTWCHLHASKISECIRLSLLLINNIIATRSMSLLALSVRLQSGVNKLRYVLVGWGDSAMMLLLAITLDFDVNAWMAPDGRVNACDLPNIFQPLQFRRGTSSTPR
jgi:hypothetical protein